MNKIIYIFSILIILVSCVNIAPDEEWDNDDTRIWIKYASGLDLTVHWFTEKESNRQKTILDYQDEFENEIKSQVTNSAYFNETQTIDLDSDLWKEIIKEKVMGVWHENDKGFRFLQAPGNQYPVKIEMDTIQNLIIIESKK